MNIIKFLRNRCPICFRSNEAQAAIQKELDTVRSTLDNREKNIEFQRETLIEKDALLDKREQLLEDKNGYLVEKEFLLGKREKQITMEKETLLDKDSILEKRQIILPALREKWKAEAMRIDQERIDALKNVRQNKTLIQDRVSELNGALIQIKKRPSSQSNHDLRIEFESRLNELEKIINIVDTEVANENKVSAS